MSRVMVAWIGLRGKFFGRSAVLCTDQSCEEMVGVDGEWLKLGKDCGSG